MASERGGVVLDVLVGLLTVPQPDDRKVAAGTLGLRLDAGAVAATVLAHACERLGVYAPGRGAGLGQ